VARLVGCLCLLYATQVHTASRHVSGLMMCAALCCCSCRQLHMVCLSYSTAVLHATDTLVIFCCCCAVAWCLCSLRTTLCVRYKGSVVACGIIFYTARKLQVRCSSSSCSVLGRFSMFVCGSVAAPGVMFSLL
jgi:hypothetical protein